MESKSERGSRLTPEQRRLVATEGYEAARVVVDGYLKRKPFYRPWREDILQQAMLDVTLGAPQWTPGSGRFFSWAYSSATFSVGKTPEKIPVVAPTRVQRKGQERRLDFADHQSISSPLKGHEGKVSVGDTLVDEGPLQDALLESAQAPVALAELKARMLHILKRKTAGGSYALAAERNLDLWFRYRLGGKTYRDSSEGLEISHARLQQIVRAVQSVADAAAEDMRALRPMPKAVVKSKRKAPPTSSPRLREALVLINGGVPKGEAARRVGISRQALGKYLKRAAA